MNNSNFKALIESLKDLTPTQKKYLLSLTKMAIDDESNILNTSDMLTSEELEALLSSAPNTNAK